jgi:8-oxo-dGTP diphosphatase
MPIDLPKPALTVDVLVFSILEGTLKVLLIRRKNPPFAGCWAVPGGFVDSGETPREAALRELEEETSVSGVEIREFGAFGDPGRDPRGWTVSITYFALVSGERVTVRGGDDAAEAGWHAAERPPMLAFDHAEILAQGVESLRKAALADAAVAPLLPAAFSWAQLCGVYEIIFAKRLDRRRLRRVLLSSGLIQRSRGGSGKTGYRFERRGLLERFCWPKTE